MPLLRCRDPECGHQWFERSHLTEGADCVECGGPTRLVDQHDSDDPSDDRGPPSSSQPQRSKARISFARDAAKAMLRKHGIKTYPVPLVEIVRKEGLAVIETPHLPGEIRALLIDDRIEVAVGDSDNVKRFSIAHELGHWSMGTVHNSGPHVETEANVFANELLVPRAQLRLAIETTPNERALADAFGVSMQVIRIAIQHVGRRR